MRQTPVVALILARGGSKAVPRKNIRLLGGKPLIAYTIEAAKMADCVDRVFVTTEDKEIADISASYGAEVLPRPACLAEDEVQSDEVFLYALRQLHTEIGIHPATLVMLPPTSPFRTATHIDEAFEMRRGVETIIGATRNVKYHWDVEVVDADGGKFLNYRPVGNDPQRRDGRQWTKEDDWLFEESGSLYIVDADRFARHRCYRLPPYKLYILPEHAGLEIDTEYDLWLCEQYLAHLESFR